MIAVPDPVARAIDALNRAVGQPVIVVGGWGVHCRLTLAGGRARPTEDLDVVLSHAMRPARAAFDAIEVVQNDPSHPARLAGLPLLVDLLADDPGEAVQVEPGLVTDPDGLRMMVPPFADLFHAGATVVALASRARTTEVMLPTAGALFASKVGNLFLEHRERGKWMTDALDALSLLEAYSPSVLAADLARAPAARRRLVADRLEQIGYGGLAAQARLGGGAPYPDGSIAVPALVVMLRTEI